MTKLTKKDEFLERLGIEMDHVKAGLMELKTKSRKLKLEARLEYDQGLLMFRQDVGRIDAVS